jgi:hypothetical protein
MTVSTCPPEWISENKVIIQLTTENISEPKQKLLVVLEKKSHKSYVISLEKINIYANKL